MEDARDEGWRGVQEPEVGFEVVIVRARGRVSRPENWVVVGEEGEDDAEEEACRWGLSGLALGVSRMKHTNCRRDIRQTIR